MTDTLPPAHAQTASEERVETRLTDLEIKQSYSDDLLEQLNMLVYQQQMQIDALKSHILHLQQVQGAASSQGSNSAREELPPHY